MSLLESLTPLFYIKPNTNNKLGYDQNEILHIRLTKLILT